MFQKQFFLFLKFWLILNHFPVVLSPLWVSRCRFPVVSSRCTSPFWGRSPRARFPRFPTTAQGFWVISSLWILSPKPFALFLPWGQARDSIQGPLVSDQLDSIPNLGLNPWLRLRCISNPYNICKHDQARIAPTPKTWHYFHGTSMGLVRICSGWTVFGLYHPEIYALQGVPITTLARSIPAIFQKWCGFRLPNPLKIYFQRRVFPPKKNKHSRGSWKNKTRKIY